MTDSPSIPTPPAPRRQAGLAALLMTAAAVWLLAPQIGVAGQAVAGGPIAQADGWQNVWNLWWVRHALLHGDNPLFTDLQFAPWGVSLALQTLNITNALLTLPVLLLATPLHAYALAAVLGFALSGWTTYLLAYRVSRSYVGALVAGLLVVLAPQHLGRFLDGQLEHVSIQWLPLALLAALHARDNPTWRSGIWLALAVALVAYTSWYQALFLGIVLLIWLVWQVLLTPHRRQRLLPWLVAAGIGVLLLLPVFPALFGDVRAQAEDAARIRTQAAAHSVDLLDPLLPSAYHPWWGAQIMAWQQPLHENSIGWVVTYGYVALLLFAVGVWRGGQLARLWAGLAGALVLLALGPTLRVAGYDTGLPLPYAALLHLPGGSLARRPNIAMEVALIPVAVVAACGVRAVLTRLPETAGRLLLAGLVGLLLLETLPPPMQIFPDDTPAVYTTLRDTPGALLVFPLDPGSLALKSAALRAQMTHGRPVIGGYVARPPAYPLRYGAPLIGTLYQADCPATDILVHSREETLAALRAYGVSQIVVHPPRMSPREERCALREIEGRLGLTATLSDTESRLYAVPDLAPQPFLYRGSGWNALEQAADSSTLFRWMRERGRLYLMNPADAPQPFVVQWHGQSYAEPRLVRVTLGDTLLGSVQMPASERVYQILVPAPAGEHELVLHAPASDDPAAPGRLISVVIEQITLQAPIVTLK